MMAFYLHLSRFPNPDLMKLNLLNSQSGKRDHCIRYVRGIMVIVDHALGLAGAESPAIKLLTLILDLLLSFWFVLRFLHLSLQAWQKRQKVQYSLSRSFPAFYLPYYLHPFHYL